MIFFEYAVFPPTFIVKPKDRQNVWQNLWTYENLTFTTLCSEKKHPLTFSFISPRMICGFKQKLQ